MGGVVNAANAATPTVKSTLRLKSSKVKRRDAAQKQFWFCNPTTAEGSDCFAKHIAWHREQENGGGGGD